MPFNITQSNMVSKVFSLNNNQKKCSDNSLYEKTLSIKNKDITLVPNVYSDATLFSNNKNECNNHFYEEISSVENKSISTESNMDLMTHFPNENKKLYSNSAEGSVNENDIPLSDNDESYNVVSDNKQASETDENIYLDMSGSSNKMVDKKENDEDEQYIGVDHDYDELDDLDSRKITFFNDEKKPKLPKRNLTAEEKEIASSKIKSELADYLINIFIKNEFRISKHQLIAGINKNPTLDLFSPKCIDDVNVENFISSYINDIPSLDYSKIMTNKGLIDEIKNALFIFSYLFNKNVERNITGFFMEDFSKLDKLNGFQEFNLYVDITEKILDCIIDRTELMKTLVGVLNTQKSKLEEKLIILNALLEHKNKFIDAKEKAFNDIKKIIESSVKKLDKFSFLNKIRLSEESKKTLSKEMIMMARNKKSISMDELSSSIIDKIEVKKELANKFFKKIEQIPIELILSKEHRKMTNSIINIFVEELKNSHVIKTPNDIKLYDKIDIELMLLQLKN